ncbi:hypothetical protein DY000_02017078 [Brassica cretica]|uniref:Uncharacterized protein n=1 Tax=Brassica cretica TaxID=69181 RepID=A0ABQ7CY25_BRACR|nr:hypothetical protein DY000_02017078 [Brassica cretica]
MVLVLPKPQVGLNGPPNREERELIVAVGSRTGASSYRIVNVLPIERYRVASSRLRSCLANRLKSRAEERTEVAC